jgi:hypothetical protein
MRYLIFWPEAFQPFLTAEPQEEDHTWDDSYQPWLMQEFVALEGRIEATDSKLPRHLWQRISHGKMHATHLSAPTSKPQAESAHSPSP